MSLELQFQPLNPEIIDVATFPLAENADVSTMVLEPKWLFNKGLIGWCDQRKAFVYDYEKLIIAMMKAWKCDEQRAIDYLHYNTMGTMEFVLHCQPNIQTCLIVEHLDKNKYIIISGVEIEDLDEPVFLNMIGETLCEQQNPV